MTQPTVDQYLLPVSKIAEHIVHSFIKKHLNNHNILTNCQHGFTESEVIDRNAANSHIARHCKGYSEFIYKRGCFGLCEGL